MKNKALAVAFIALALASCKQDGSDGTPNLTAGSNASPASAVDVNTPPGIKFTEIALDPKSTEVMNIKTGDVVTIKFPSPIDGEISNVQVLVGNYSNSSVGDLSAELCFGDKCTSGQVPLKQSKDNQYFLLPIADKLTVKSGDALSLKLSRLSGGNNFGIYMYGIAQGSNSGTVAADGSELSKVPRVRLGVKN